MLSALHIQNLVEENAKLKDELHRLREQHSAENEEQEAGDDDRIVAKRLQGLLRIRRTKSESLLAGQLQEVERLEAEVKRLKKELNHAETENVILNARISDLENQRTERDRSDQASHRNRTLTRTDSSVAANCDPLPLELDEEIAQGDQESSVVQQIVDAGAASLGRRQSPISSPVNSDCDGSTNDKCPSRTISLPRAAKGVKWAEKAFDALDTDLGSTYSQLLTLWMEAEGLHNWKERGTKLSVTGRPSIMKEWIKSGRRTLKSKADNKQWVEVDSVESFAEEVKEWWKTLSLDPKIHSYNGKNGWYTILICVNWWGVALKERNNPKLAADWDGFMRDLSAVLVKAKSKE